MGKLKRLMNAQARREQIEKAAEKVAPKIAEKLIGKNPTLASICLGMKKMIAVAGVTQIRSKIIEWVENDIKEVLSKNPDKSKAKAVLYGMMATAAGTPEYVELLAAVDMNVDHVKVLIDKATEEPR